MHVLAFDRASGEGMEEITARRTRLQIVHQYSSPPEQSGMNFLLRRIVRSDRGHEAASQRLIFSQDRPLCRGASNANVCAFESFAHGFNRPAELASHLREVFRLSWIDVIEAHLLK